MTDTAFSSLALPTALLDTLQQLGYEKMTPIQAQSLPRSMAGEDLIAKAKTGSGKTAAFGIGLLLRLKPAHFAVQALVLCPTRELSTQVATELRRLARFQQNTKIITLCGGQPIGPQIGSLEHGAHIVVGTPGRIADHLRKGTLKLDKVKTLVLDEADRMLDMGFIEAIEGIIDHTPGNRQTLLFSATYPKQIRQLSSRFQNNPVEVSVESVHSPQQITQLCYPTSEADKDDLLVRLLSHFRPASCVLFCNTKQQCETISAMLRDQGFSAGAMHGDMMQKERDQMLIQFANGSCSILAATDVAARGLDINDLPAVINYDLPRNSETYVHRIGRTGRAGKEGLALSLYTDYESRKIRAIEEYQQQPLPLGEMGDLPSQVTPMHASMVTLCISGGRKDKVRPGDILGALTGEAGIAGDLVGKINILDHVAFVAIKRDTANQALGRLINGKIKGRKFKVRPMEAGLPLGDERPPRRR
ncbi:ATP-dependent RNA helicase DbpA [Aestuariirhabdus sp. Z084]|uniref:ATP-dependent RNA helicase DbpA n=1 Tax=Aestuariirhabdus haliotis TaxID=2918751 RepID=UPI00201B3BDB|nr:ATP-dependent RNA helicase DbpA [Aestuariirhabdus haliotis]MCL6415709.1 ATP-dependent RNA helicase DbpA [Aestuariirhabdus haliotis]MCL6419765.1 ATP-dependent RNA helicase DbpA [Aestuariirhabdus haliotis]